MSKRINIIGKKFGKLKVTGFVGIIKGATVWDCECDCGKNKKIKGTSLTSGHTKSCGCGVGQERLNLIGKKFGRLVVIGFSKAGKNGQSIWHCKCSCDKEIDVIGRSLTAGNTRSCGCLNREQASKHLTEINKINVREKHPRWIIDRNEVLVNEVFDSYKRGAKNRNLIFDLTKEDVRKLISQNCYYCGLKPSSVIKDGAMKSNLYYNGIDRVDNNNGYSINNCVTCCGICNIMKLNYTVDEFLSHIRLIYNKIK